MIKRLSCLLIMSCNLFAAEKLSPKDLLVVAYDWKVGVTQRCDVQHTNTPQPPILICGKQIHDEWNHMNDVGKNVALKTSSQMMKVMFPNPMLQLKLSLLEDPRVDSSNARIGPISCTRTKAGLTCR